MSTNVAVIILTRNEEENIEQALRSVLGWAREVHVLDSLSTDRTCDIARELGARVTQHKFEDFGRQRNFALDHLSIQADWIFFLDADEWLPDAFKAEVDELLASGPRKNGFYAARKFIWMGKWIKRGYFPVWILRLFRRGKARCEERIVNEHVQVEGEVGYLREAFIHEDRTGIQRWIAKHNDYARKEALELLRQKKDMKGQVQGRFWGGQVERKRWLRHKVFNRIPPLVRPFGFFTYRYILRGGFLDGKAALSYHLLQAFWFPLLVDVNYLELRNASRQRWLGGQSK